MNYKTLFLLSYKENVPLNQLEWDILFYSYSEELLLAVTVAAHKLINATGRINQLRLTCIERVRGA